MRAPSLLIVAVPPLITVYILVMLFTMDLSLTVVQYLIIMPLAYVLGSIPWGFLLIKLTRDIDIRDYGSGNIGTSNVLRSAGGRLAALVLLLDASKGLLIILLARALSDSAVTEALAGIAVVVGHNWSMFLSFKGGRGIATGAGCLLIMSPIALAIGLAVFLLITLTTRYLSLGSLIGAVTAIVALSVQAILGIVPQALIIYGIVVGIMIIWQHRGNIKRLRHGKERTLGQSSQKDNGSE